MNVASWVRSGLAIVVLSLGLPAADAAPLALEWADLVPPDPAARPAPTVGRTGVLSHEQGALLAPTDRLDRSPVRGDLDGKEVSIAGYVVPLGLDGVKVKDFLIAPYIGACVHVPPPPSNQLVFTHFATGLEMSMRLFTEPVVVVGKLTTTAAAVDLGEQGNYTVGYQLQAAKVSYLVP